jgi:hypothetical protein
MAQRATTKYENNNRTGILPVLLLFSWESGGTAEIKTTGFLLLQE